MNKNLRTMNYYAVMSTTVRNINGLSRRFYRMLYRNGIKRYCNSSEWRDILMEHEKNPDINPYPWPLFEPDFASWEESDAYATYSLISDPSGMVVKYSTSYCACMIYGYTGKWLEYEPGKRDANNWVSVLSANGFNRVVAAPRRGGKYVGLLKDETADNGHGLVVWFDDIKDKLVRYSTYQNHRYHVSKDFALRFVWIEICPSNSLA